MLKHLSNKRYPNAESEGGYRWVMERDTPEGGIYQYSVSISGPDLARTPRYDLARRIRIVRAFVQRRCAPTAGPQTKEWAR